MTDSAFEKLHARAREVLLSTTPIGDTEEVTRVVLLDVAERYDVAEEQQDEFVDELMPAVAMIISSIRAKVIREMEEAAFVIWKAKSINPPQSESSDHVAIEGHTWSVASPAAEEELANGGAEPNQLSPTSVPESSDQAIAGIHRRSVADSGAGEGDQQQPEDHVGNATSSAPQDDGQRLAEDHATNVVPAEQSDESAIEHAPTKIEPPAVTPLSLRMEVLDTWRPLAYEKLHVPEFTNVTYGSANKEQRQRAMTWYHSQSMGWLRKSQRLRALDAFLEEQKVGTLNELLGKHPALRS